MSIATIAGNPCLLPLEYRRADATLRWYDVGGHPFSDAFFDWTVDDWKRRNGSATPLETDVSVLWREQLIPNAIAPSAFIFHMSRCGSTLLARALASCARIVVMSEPGPVNELLLQLCNGDRGAGISEPLRLRMLRNLLLALGRRRAPGQRYYAVKFSSWNVGLIDAIMRALPGVPALFLYRSPPEVMVSLLQGPAGFMRDRSGVLARFLCPAAGRERDVSEPVFVAACLRTMLASALGSADAAYLDYACLSRDALPGLLRFFGIECTQREVARMQAQFDFNAKAREPGVAFADDRAAKRAAVTAEITGAAGCLLELCGALAASPRNLGSALR